MSSVPSNSHRHSRALGAGLTLAVSVALFAYGGLWLDRRFGTKPWCTLALVLCGIVGGILHTIRVLAPEAWPFGARPDSTKKNHPDSKIDGRRPPGDPPA